MPATTSKESGSRGSMDIKEYFARISYRGSYDKPDLATLTDIFQHHIRAVPFENLNIHCGERIVLDLEVTFNKIVRKNRGGWCMENNNLLSWVLKTLGYDVTLLGAKVFVPEYDAYAEEIDHLLLKVVLDNKSYIVDGGFGMACQMWQPMELVSGRDQPQTPGIFRFLEDNGVWYLEKMRRKQCTPDGIVSTSHELEIEGRRRIYHFTLQPQDIEEFRARNNHLQTAPKSLFVLKSLCSLQTTDGIRSLVGWKFTEMKYNYKDNMDLVEIKILADDEIEKTLKEKFNITLDKKLVPVNRSRLSVV
ncbi:arylamine N-acetyltransferase, pineal gland isozyme NAT-3-like [Falco biarmicus]|uniref:arylamine N-acetyltransferase, pineal gland isozyme NAT-3-like n=1 Tax=Falco peregrinus TaxID=8954 RepID=UPI00067853F7|nr:arylamine N-acetyltransferase, pineal gland isozyme NAT-3-like [Falco peregrinus]XP_013152530.1 arylamine N-acetyltransferase, pineal gland isozyme NAT-3-like [Falco peregrinus]XP_013152531.1 arylamine N-acetyltransferase, pineal gland isozyme NAT-3-like [Falco peregrinus]XP_014134353.2 arylamine N-acetyltransferase, pineal gland isozyme NAT-3-like [Falco cherrug]XP_027638755.1 arylamine N-acetyltransferase, pineal gland isozyme NAT-3-like [Falco peregrinus]XP_027659024.2 arylamine N-acetyl